MLGDRIREQRKAHNLTQVQLASQLDVSKQSVSNWENGNILPSIEMLMKISKQFSVSTDYLLCLDDETSLKIEGLTMDQFAHVQDLIRYLQKLNEKSKPDR